MKIENIKLHKLKHPDKNVRIHSKHQIEELSKSVSMFGQTRPIICDENYNILAGNGLYDALVLLGRDSASVHVVKGLSDSQKKKLMLADNRIYNLGSDDQDVQREFLSAIAGLGDYDVPGFDEGLIRSLALSLDEIEEDIVNYGKIESQTGSTGNRTDEYTGNAAGNGTDDTTDSAVESRHNEAKKDTAITCPHCNEMIWL